MAGLYENAPEIQLYCVFRKFFDALCRTQMLQERGGFCLCSGNSLLAPSGAAVVN